MSKRLGLVLFFGNDGSLEVSSLRPITREEAQAFVNAKIMAAQIAEGDKARRPAPAYWVPLDAFNPIDNTGSVELTPEIIEQEGRRTEEGCDDEDCPVHGQAANGDGKHQDLGKVLRKKLGQMFPGATFVQLQPEELAE